MTTSLALPWSTRLLSFAVLVAWTLVVGAAAVVVLTYARALRAQPERGGLLLWHVVGVASATVTAGGGLCLATLELLGLVSTLRDLRLSIYLAAAVLFLVALFLISKTSRRRVQPHQPSVVERTEATTLRLGGLDEDGHREREAT